MLGALLRRPRNIQITWWTLDKPRAPYSCHLWYCLDGNLLVTTYTPDCMITPFKMGGLSEDRPKKGRGRRKVERKGQQKGAMENNKKNSHTAV